MNVRVGDIIKLENNQFVAVRKSTHTHAYMYTRTHAHTHPIIHSIMINEIMSFFFLPKSASVTQMQSGRC